MNILYFNRRIIGKKFPEFGEVKVHASGSFDRIQARSKTGIVLMATETSKSVSGYITGN